MKRNIGRVIWTILAILWMGVIFYFSAQPGDESQDLSNGVSYKIVRTVEKAAYLLNGSSLIEEERLEYAGLIDFPVRKGAHMTEYGILSLFILGAWNAWLKKDFSKEKDLVKADILRKREKKRKKIRYLHVLALTFLYAGSDEIHQLFVVGRSGQFVDVLIDSLGAAIFLSIVYLISAHAEAKKDDIIF